MNEIQKTTLVRAINHFGVEAQTEKAMEEMGELITELSRRHSYRGDKEKIAEEVADALVMMEQLRIIYGGERVDGYVARKLERLEKNMNGDWKRQEKMMPPGMVVHRSESLACADVGKAAAAGFSDGKLDFSLAEKIAKWAAEQPLTVIPGKEPQDGTP